MTQQEGAPKNASATVTKRNFVRDEVRRNKFWKCVVIIPFESDTIL